MSLPNYRPFKSVLIANRGEIAVRIVRETKAAGLRAIAVYSDADRRALHVEEADAAVHIGPAPARDSYLNVENILAAAKSSGAEAIHPGYGFLSENPDFAQSVVDAGLVWIGPSPAAIRAMADKGNAKEIARKVGVPVIPGYDGDDQSETKLLAEAKKTGWPVLIKAALGGGGRGQRRVTQEADFADALASAKREAMSAFASDRMILEHALDNVRHVEIQVFGDAHGSVIHLGERDCSVQRRNQKIIEEAPAPGVSEDLRKRMGDAAVALAKAVSYVNAGTVEYLLDREGHFYFLEMNTRIQVEHPVTEEVTGTNLIQWQFAVARGDPLPLKQTDVKITGHAIEVRLCAEDPAEAFSPQSGLIVDFFANRSKYKYRLDSSLRSGLRVGGDYDSMLAKVIAKGETRDQSRKQLVGGLGEINVAGVRTNKSYLIDLLESADFARGTVDINWVNGLPPFADRNLHGDLGALAALYLAHGTGGGFASTGFRRVNVRLREREEERTFVVENGCVDDIVMTESHPAPEDDWLGRIHAEGPHGRLLAFVEKHGNRIQLDTRRKIAIFEDITYAPAEPKGASGANAIRAPMAGRIVKVIAEPGANVAKGQLLVILEAMKMEHELRAAADATVETVSAKPGDQVSIRQVLVTLKPA